jgi:hypothetical protein
MGANLSFIWPANATATEANKLERRRRRKGEKINKKRLDRISSCISSSTTKQNKRTTQKRKY